MGDFPWARIPLAVSFALTVVLVGRAASGAEVPAWAIAGDLVLLLATVGAGVFVQNAGLFGRPLCRVEPARAQGLVALTFDDGPDATSTREILALLRQGGHRATFFVIGSRAEASPELLAEIRREGHALGNHSYAHAHVLPFWSANRLEADFLRAQAVLERAGTQSRWFRPPFGVLSPPVARAAARAGLRLVGWSATARDGIASTTVAAATRRLTRALVPGAILVLHDAAEHSDRAPIAPQVLAALLPELASRHLRSVTLDDLGTRQSVPLRPRAPA